MMLHSGENWCLFSIRNYIYSIGYAYLKILVKKHLSLPFKIKKSLYLFVSIAFTQ